jgi:hypothetical protein
MTRTTDIRIPVTADEKAAIEANVRDIAATNGIAIPSVAAIVRALILGADRKTKLNRKHMTKRGRTAETQEVQ